MGSGAVGEGNPGLAFSIRQNPSDSGMALAKPELGQFRVVGGHDDFTRSSEREGFEPFNIRVESLICASTHDSLRT